MTQVQARFPAWAAMIPPNKTSVTLVPPLSVALPPPRVTFRIKNLHSPEAFPVVNQNGSFEFDRIIKSGYLRKRTQKTKTWKSVYLVYRPETLSIYKDDKENKFCHKVYLSDLTAVTMLKDPRHKRDHIFGLFSPSKNFHFQAPTEQEARDWVDLIRKDARIEEEEEEMFLATPSVRRESFTPPDFLGHRNLDLGRILQDGVAAVSSSPEVVDLHTVTFRCPPYKSRRPSPTGKSSGVFEVGMPSHSDLSDCDIRQDQGGSTESLAVKSRPPSVLALRSRNGASNCSQDSGWHIEQDPDRIIWQGWLLWLRSKGAVRQWKNCWAVLRPRNLILYKDESEYAVQFIIHMGTILNVVDTDPMSKTRSNCIQIITEERSYRLCAHDEESLVKCLGAFRSVLAKRRELEAKRAIGPNSTSSSTIFPAPHQLT